MTERDFWLFLKQSIAAQGRMNMVSGCIDSDNREVSENGVYLSGHSVLFNGHDRIPIDKVKDIGHLLSDPIVSICAKEVILMLLAHQPTKCALNILRTYNKNPDKELRYFAETALWECGIWNE